MSVTVGSLGKVMKFLPILLVEVLNPLFVISVALYVGLGYILTLLTSVDISLWQSVFLFSVLLPLLLLLRAKSIWNGAMVEEARSTWRQSFRLYPCCFFYRYSLWKWPIPICSFMGTCTLAILSNCFTVQRR